jgi:hypothetical protein
MATITDDMQQDISHPDIFRYLKCERQLEQNRRECAAPIAGREITPDLNRLAKQSVRFKPPLQPGCPRDYRRCGPTRKQLPLSSPKAAVYYEYDADDFGQRRMRQSAIMSDPARIADGWS